MEHRYTLADRREQLETLVEALDELIPLVLARPEYVAWAHEYRTARSRAAELLQAGFDQADLSSLSRAVPELSHKDWEPLEKMDDGQWREPAWFVGFASKHQSVSDAATLLRTVGYYRD